MVLATGSATGSCGPTPGLGVHRIATYARFSMFKKPNFNPVPDFHGPTSQSGPVLKTMITNNMPKFLIEKSIRTICSRSFSWPHLKQRCLHLISTKLTGQNIEHVNLIACDMITAHIWWKPKVSSMFGCTNMVCGLCMTKIKHYGWILLRFGVILCLIWQL